MTYLDPHLAAAVFAQRLATQTDVSDVHAAHRSAAHQSAADEGAVREDRASPDGEADFVLVDVRNEAAWRQGHIPGAVHLPRAQIPQDTTLRPAQPVVTYCWGPGCNGATRAAQALAERDFRVKEMLGGIEYWIREGFAIETAAGEVRLPVDTLTACGC